MIIHDDTLFWCKCPECRVHLREELGRAFLWALLMFLVLWWLPDLMEMM